MAKAPKAREKRTKLGRNNPCWCGSGRKYKECHLPIEEVRRADQRRLVETQDTLWATVMETAQAMPEAFPLAFEHFWGGKYTVDQMSELDDLEHRGAERFLTWFAFDHVLDTGQTLIECLAARPAQSDDATAVNGADDTMPSLDEMEHRLLHAWSGVRLRPYLVQAVQKGQGFTAYDLLDEQTYQVIDHAAARRLEPDEVIVGHIVPIGGSTMLTTPLLTEAQMEHTIDIPRDQLPTAELDVPAYYIAGAIAQLTADVREKLQEFANLHLHDIQRTHTDATWADLLHDRSYAFNHFVMALPVAEQDINVVENFVEQTRFSLLSGVAMWRSMFVKDDDHDVSEGKDTPDTPEVPAE